jgi:hypothetical protein
MERVSFLLESLSGRVKLEGPQEVVGFLEFRTASDNFVDQVFNTDDSVLAEFFLDNFVVGNGNSASVNLTISSLVDEVSDGLSRWITISNVRFNFSNHVDGGLVEFDESTVVKLSQSKELQNLLASWVQLIDTIKLRLKMKY